MADFTQAEDVRLIKEGLDAFLEQEIEPLEEELRDLLVPDFKRLRDDGRLKADVVDAIDTVRRKSGEAGYYGIDLPEEAGGGGASIVELVRVLFHLYSRGLGLKMYVIEGAAGPHSTLLELDDELKTTYLEPAIAGRKSGCFALTESTSGSDALNMETTAERDGDEWVIDGTKMWITNSPYADYGQVFAVTDPDEEGQNRVSSLLFDTDNPGFSVKRINQTLFNDGMQAEVEFDDCRVPDTHLIGERGEGFHNAMRFVNEGRLRIAARCAGLMSYLLEESVDYANGRKAWGEPIGSRQHVRRMVADIATWQETAENLVLKAAWRVDRGDNPAKQSAIAKYYATEKLFEAADNAVQVFGANGLSHELPVQRVFRYARLLRIPEGTSEIQIETIASEVGL